MKLSAVDLPALCVIKDGSSFRCTLSHHGSAGGHDCDLLHLDA